MVAGEPFLLHQLRLLAKFGATRAVLCVGYLGDLIQARIGDEQFGISLTYSYDSPGLDGTLGAIRKALPLLGQHFLVLYGDTYLRLDYVAFEQQWRASSLPGAMTVLRNNGRWDRSNVAYRAGRVLRYDKWSPTPDMEWIDYGLGGLTAEALEVVPNETTDLSHLYAALAESHQLFGFETTERFYEIGTRSSLEETSYFLRSTKG
jgi:NDP-sugar pyrophosphorylase family protein